VPRQHTRLGNRRDQRGRKVFELGEFHAPNLARSPEASNN